MKFAKVFGMLAMGATLWAADPMVGTWKLDVAKSKYSPGPAPSSATVTYEETADGIKRSGESINADGTKASFTYTAKYDGKDYPVSGSNLFDTISVKKINDHTVASTLKKSGKVVSTSRRVVSKDGKTMTLTINGTNAKGEKTHNVQVFDKQ
jgi:ABC-type transport system substrate-binding protein